jgi:hypothetical protein
VLQLIYTSAAVAPLSPDALRTLLIRARERNAAAGITGMLLHVDAAFLQVLEGDPDAVQQRFMTIAADYRHHRILLLTMRDIPDRSFPDASMGLFDASGHSVSLPGYRRSTGFADLVGDPTTVARVVTDFRDGRWHALAA